jgi:hypothetical protein
MISSLRLHESMMAAPQPVHPWTENSTLGKACDVWLERPTRWKRDKTIQQLANKVGVTNINAEFSDAVATSTAEFYGFDGVQRQAVVRVPGLP